jgi:hypothetical protein
METISIKSNNPFSLKPIEDTLSRHWPVEANDFGLVVHGSERDRAYLNPDPESPLGTRER